MCVIPIVVGVVVRKCVLTFMIQHLSWTCVVVILQHVDSGRRYVIFMIVQKDRDGDSERSKCICAINSPKGFREKDHIHATATTSSTTTRLCWAQRRDVGKYKCTRHHTGAVFVVFQAVRCGCIEGREGVLSGRVKCVRVRKG